MRTPLLPRPARWLVVLGVLVVAVGCSDPDDATGDAGDETTTTTIRASATTSTTARAVDVDQTPPVGANGIKVASDGSLLIASIGSDVILRVDADTGRILRRVATPPGTGPDDVVEAADGALYWTGYISGAVGAIDPGHDETAVLTNVGTNANPIALRGDGMLVVGRAGGATGLYTVDPSGDPTPAPLSDPGNLNSFDVASDGSIYAPDLATKSILEIDADTGATLRTVAPIVGAPIAARWHDGRVFVLVLSDRARVVRVDPATGAADVFGDTGLPAADNLAVGEDGRVYVTGLTVPTVTVLDPDGAVERTIQIGG